MIHFLVICAAVVRLKLTKSAAVYFDSCTILLSQTHSGKKRYGAHICLFFFFVLFCNLYSTYYFLKTFIISLYQHHAVSLIKNAAYCCFKEGFQVMHTVSDRPHGFTVIKMNAAVLCFSSDAAHLVELHVENLTTPVSLTH